MCVCVCVCVCGCVLRLCAYGIEVLVCYLVFDFKIVAGPLYLVLTANVVTCFRLCVRVGVYVCMYFLYVCSCVYI